MPLTTVALLGGSFDPVHRGHLLSAVELYARLGLDQLSFIPCHQPAHKDALGADSQHRLAMLELAVSQLLLDNPALNLKVDDREIQRDGISYTVETLEQMRRELGNEVSIIWVVGTDAFAGLHRWHRWQELLSLAHIVVVTRPDSHLPQTGPVADLMVTATVLELAQLKQESAGCLWFESLTPYPISATQIRQALKVGGDKAVLEDNLSPDVLRYIEQQRLYS